MGGHGGLNILPQKRWNVYNYENREKVRRDEEAAAKEEQLKQDQSRKRDAELRLETLRQARGIHVPRPQSPSPSPDPNSNSNSNSKHINLFEGLKIFPFSGRPEDDVQEDGPKKQKRQRRNDAPTAAAPKVVLPEDDKYRLGYGVAGKGVKAPWYLSRPLASEDGNGGSATAPQQAESSRKASGKKTLEELREERMKREKQEKERERALFSGRKKRDRASARLR
eukprot:TRINITY_DN40252_c0_g1_i1.p1 TRINITY_DN40252_c0_g1~~TRINITY_DN40252_c0_g1_i1.p1  ORF type:complete len:224 (-),score=64.80 TRINITY_DN40252_c0_g1_i1:427-1098(-)